MIELKSKKRIPFNSQQKQKKVYEFLYSSALSPHPQKITKGGQDALFTSKNILAIADGVGSWKDYGVDPGIYSKNLMKIISDLIKDDQKRLYYIQNPQKLASAAVNLNSAQGSTTLSIITLHPKTGVLRTYHIGDSIYGIFKQSVQQTILGVQQQYLFNHPYQVGSNFVNQQSNEQMQFCNPDSGLYNQFSYQQVCQSHIILASDGIWDNLHVNQIHQIIIQKNNSINNMKQNNINHISSLISKTLQQTVHKMITMTQKTYSIQVYQSPFYLKGKQIGLNVGKFAKVDDLSLIVAKIIEKQIISEQ